MCDTLAVPAKHALLGRTLFAKNSDRERNEVQELEWSPRRTRSGERLKTTYIDVAEASTTHACLLSRPFWMWGAEMGANEHGVVIGNEAMHALEPAQRRPALTGMDLVRLGLERGATAAEATAVITTLLETYGQGGDCGHLSRFYYHNGFVIADPHEIYVLETVGRWWALEAVSRPRALSNALSIGAQSAAVSEDLRRHARQEGWMDAQGRFDFAARLLDEARDRISFGRGRCARAQDLMARAAGRLDVAAMMSMLRDHGDGGAAKTWTPEGAVDRTICMHAGPGARRSQTVASLIAEIGPKSAVFWATASSAPCLSLFKPVLLSHAPASVSPPSASPEDLQNRWWRHERLHRRALEDYPTVLEAVKEERDALEQSFVLRLQAAESAPDADRRTLVDQCWEEGDAAEARWLRELDLRPRGARSSPFHRSWSRLNQAAGFACEGPASSEGCAKRTEESDVSDVLLRNDPGLDAFWMPFTANRQFKAAPRLLASAKGMYYRTDDGREILDGCAGLWCVNAGHGRPEIAEAVGRQLSDLDYAPSFQMSHPLAFEFAERVIKLTPQGLDRVFFTNSGSESVDTALKIAMAYHRTRGEGQRTRLIGREKGYHGVGFGGISVGGLVNNRRMFPTLPADHLPHTLDLERNAFSRGAPAHGAALADALEGILMLHGPETVAAVIVEPVAGSAGVLPPPVGYLERLRRVCDQYGVLLIFDEVITGFGRLGRPFASQVFGVVPDLMTTAKGLTNGAFPMGAVFAKREIHDAFMRGGANVIELFHGYTYSAHPAACAAGMATLDIYDREHLLTRAADVAPQFEEAVHGLRDLPNVIDIRNLGLMAAVDLQPRPGAPGARGYEALVKAFEAGLLIRATGDTIALSPPLIIATREMDRLFTTLRAVLQTVD